MAGSAAGEFDEAELVRRAQQGDAQAFGALYDQHVDRVYAYIAHRVGNRADAEDLTQEVFLRALASLSRFRWRGSLLPWLLTIARNLVTDHQRRRRREGAWPAAPLTAPAEDPVELAERRRQRERLRAAAAELTELQQQVIALRFAAGLSIAETARVMGRSENAVKNLQHKAIAALRRRLKGEGG
ncbi:MAG: RNA polymerase sigma factor [Ardenticatenia bacterium]|nr:RNA polymerase sigma factor [Ardenticatenia bacterium]